MIEVIVDGVTFSSLGLGLKKHNIPVLPPTQDNAVALAERDGELDFGSTYGPRTFNLECVLMADDATIGYHLAVAKIAAVFNVKKGGIPITFSDLPNRIYMGRYAGTMDIEKIIYDGEFTIPIKMVNPFPQSSEQLTELLITQSPQVIQVQSGGDERASPIIVLTNQGPNTIKKFMIKNEYLLEG